jgi:YbbR domain-containing protein
MKNKILNNLGLKILSVVFAILLWIVVMNVSDSLVSEKIENIPVEILNEDVLDQLDKVYYIQTGETVSIVVKGKRSVVERLTARDFVATADLSQMSITNAVQIMVEAVDDDVARDVTITCTNNTMELSLEEKITRQFPIKINVSGTPKDGYAVGDVSSTPNIITVEGPESAVEKIVEIGTVINVESATEDCTSVCNIRAYDAYGKELNNEYVNVSQDTAEVTVKIYPDKTVPVNITVKGTPGSGYEMAAVNYEPKELLITGPEDILDGIDSIEIDDISIAGLTENYETTLDVSNYLPSGALLAQDSGSIVVSVVIEKVVEKTFSITADEIELKNTNSDYEYSVGLSSDYSIVVSGLEENMEDVKLEDFAPYIDCEKLDVGDNYNVGLILAEKDGVTVELNGSIEIQVSEKE